jgi:hypothetical protein
LSALVQFSYLQLLDLLTTIAFLAHGGKEANPLVRFVLAAGPPPFVGLAAIKVASFALALYCVRSARVRLLSRVNLFFAALVAWNLCVLILSARHLAG